MYSLIKHQFLRSFSPLDPSVVLFLQIARRLIVFILVYLIALPISFLVALATTIQPLPLVLWALAISFFVLSAALIFSTLRAPHSEHALREIAIWRHHILVRELKHLDSLLARHPNSNQVTILLQVNSLLNTFKTDKWRRPSELEAITPKILQIAHKFAPTAGDLIGDWAATLQRLNELRQELLGNPPVADDTSLTSNSKATEVARRRQPDQHT